MDSARTSRPGLSARFGLDAQLILDTSPNAVVAVDSRGRIRYANPRLRETFGWSPEELTGGPVERLIPQRFAADHIGRRRGFRDHPAARPMGIGLELVARRRDGTEFPAEISLAPVQVHGGPLVLATIVDITERRALQEQLQGTEEELRHQVGELEQRGRELALMAQLGELLGSCQTIEEAYTAIAGKAAPLFGGDAGALYELSAPHAPAAEAVVAWLSTAGPAVRGGRGAARA